MTRATNTALALATVPTSDQGADGPKMGLVLISPTATVAPFGAAPAEPAANDPAGAIPSKRPNAGDRRGFRGVLSKSLRGRGEAGSRCLASRGMGSPSRFALSLLPLLARCVRIWFSTGSLTITGLYLLAELALCHPRLRAAARLLPAAGLAIDVIWFESPWTWTDAVDALVQVAELVIVQLVTARLIEPELVVCPTCLGTSSASTPITKISRRQNPVGAEDTAAKIAAIQTSAEAAAPALRGCPDAPNNLSAQLQVHHRRGTVLMVDGETFDDQNPWHTCVRRELGHLEFPSTRTPVKARIRFSLR